MALSPDQVTVIRERRAAGAMLAALGDEFGVTRERIRQLTVGIKPRRTCRVCEAEFFHDRSPFYCSAVCRKSVETERLVGLCECGAQRSARSQKCIDCRRRDFDAIREARWAYIKTMWDAGLSMAEIAKRVASGSVNSLGVQLARMRAAGIELAYRRDGWQGGDWSAAHARRRPPRTRQQARNQFSQAKRRGEVTPPSACERCGREGYVDGHHHDYSKPLDVEWLCRPCHIAHHHGDERPEASAAA